MTNAQGTIEVTVRYPRFAFVYGWSSPTIEIDDQKHKTKWGSHEFNLTAGSHVVSASYPWFLDSECGKASVIVELPPSSKIRVEYVARYVRYLPGKIKAVQDPVFAERQ